MPTVANRCAELQAQLGRLRQTQDNQAKAKALGDRREELEVLRLKFTRLTATTTVLLDRQHFTRMQLPKLERVKKARQECASVRQRLDADLDSLTTGRDYKNLLKHLEEIGQSLELSTGNAWREWVKTHEGGDEQFLTQVEQVPGQAKAVAAIRLARKALADASAQVPVSDEQYQDFLRCSGNLQLALSAINPADFPADVLGFFKKALSPGGAPVSLLTAEVRAWLERKGMLDGLRIRSNGRG